jgi:hypothetical protein
MLPPIDQLSRASLEQHADFPVGGLFEVLVPEADGVKRLRR